MFYYYYYYYLQQKIIMNVSGLCTAYIEYNNYVVSLTLSRFYAYVLRCMSQMLRTMPTIIV